MQSVAKKRQVFAAISDYFNHLNNASSKDTNSYAKLSVKESSTLLHMSTAICQDNALGTEYFAFVKSLKRSQITSFNVALMLIMTKLKPYKEPILLHLKKEIEALVKLRLEIEQFSWLDEKASPFSVPNMFSVFQELLQKTTYNWEILDGLIALACSFLSTGHTPSTPWWLSLNKMHCISGYSIPSTLSTYQFQLPYVLWKDKKEEFLSTKDLGLMILTELFNKHEMVRDTILELIVAQITSKSSGVPSYIELLRLLLASSLDSSSSSTSSSSSKSTSFVLSHIRTLEMLLDQLQHLPITHACSLSNVLVQLSLWHVGFRNSMVLFLRKAMVNKRSELRELSIHANLTLLKLAIQSELGEPFVYELIGILRRCFQFTNCSLKMVFYVQLAHTLEVCPSLGPFLVEPLTTALGPYIATHTSQLLLDRCIDSGTIHEPLHWLIKCYVLAAHASSTTTSSDPSSDIKSSLGMHLNSFQDVWTKLATKFQQLELFEMLPSGVSVGLSPDCLAPFARVLLYLGCFDALFEFLFLTQPSNTVLLESFYEKREAFVSHLKQHFIDAKGRKGPAASSSFQTILDSAPFYSIATLLRILPSQPLSLLKCLLPNLALAVQQHVDYPWTLETALAASKLFLSLITREQMELQTEQLRRDPKSFRFLLQYLTSFKSIFSKALVSPWIRPYLQALPNFESLFYLAKDFLLYPCAKEATLLFQVLIQAPLPDTTHRLRLQQLVLNLVCSTSLFEDETMVKPLFQLLFHLSKHMSGILVLVARNILYRWGKITTPSVDVAPQLPPTTLSSSSSEKQKQKKQQREGEGDNDMDGEGDEEPDCNEEEADLNLHAKEILDCLETYKSQVHAASALCEEIELSISELERCLLEFKTEYGKKEVDLPTKLQHLLPSFDSMVCRRFSVVLHAVLLLAQSTVKPELTLTFVKMLTKTFATLNTYLQLKEKFIWTHLGDCLGLVQMGSRLHETVALLQLAMDQTVGSHSSRTTKKTHHQAKWMATLILQVEQFDILVIQLSKRFKPLMKFIKRSMVRDFRFETHRISVEDHEKGMKKKRSSGSSSNSQHHGGSTSQLKQGVENSHEAEENGNKKENNHRKRRKL